MLLCDLVFAQNIPPLTYRVPESLRHCLKTGMIVEAPLRGRPKKALLWRLYEAEPLRDLKEISTIVEGVPPISETLMELLRWTADYYLCNEGQVLRVGQFEHYWHTHKRARSPKIKFSGPLWVGLCKEVYPADTGVSLFRTGSFRQEIGLVSRILYRVLTEEPGRTVFVLCPERHEAEEVYGHLRGILPDEQLGLYHGMLTDAQKSKVIQTLQQGNLSILVGTKSAVLLPVARLKMIIVMKEHSRQYKQEEVPKLNARDIAVKRGQIEAVPVVLTSVTPSAETSLNVLLKKYHYQDAGAGLDMPEVRVTTRTGPPVSTTVIRTTREFIKASGSVLAVVHRLGYGILQCRDCEHILRCQGCSRAMTYHRDPAQGASVVCHFCASKAKAPEACPVCGGFGLEPVGYGLQRAEEELRRHFPAVHVLKEDTPVLEPGQVYLGTLKSYSLQAETRVLLLVLNPDLFINMPELRPAERLFQDLLYLSAQLPPGSRVLVQTSQPTESFYKALRRWDYIGFIRTELDFRRSMGLPPFCRVISIMAHLRSEDSIEEVSKVLQQCLEGFSLQGPLITSSPYRGYTRMLKYILQETDRAQLKDRLTALEKQLASFRTLLRVDVDPYEP